jgi:hydroxymethylbilane synthase
MTINRITIGTRGSKLALIQASWVKAELERAQPGIATQIKIIKTSGDLFTAAPFHKLGGKGLFTKEIEEALMRREIDLAVHSLKDLPTTLPEELCLGAVSQREDPRDAFLSNQFGSVAGLPRGGRVGTSSLRRQSQLLARRPDLVILDLRGNLNTRLRKLDEGRYDAIILACAGLIRMGLGDRIRQALPIDDICPAVGQAALGIEIRCGDRKTSQWIQCLHHTETAYAVRAERSLLRHLGGGCHVPIAGHAWIEGNQIVLLGVVASVDGANLIKDSSRAPVEQAEDLGRELAIRLLQSGAGDMLGPMVDGNNG